MNIVQLGICFFGIECILFLFWEELELGLLTDSEDEVSSEGMKKEISFFTHVLLFYNNTLQFQKFHCKFKK